MGEEGVSVFVFEKCLFGVFEGINGVETGVFRPVFGDDEEIGWI